MVWRVSRICRRYQVLPDGSQSDRDKLKTWGTRCPNDSSHAGASSPNLFNTTSKETQLQMWNERLRKVPDSEKMDASVAESLPAADDEPWQTGRCLNRRCTGVGCSRELKKWGYTTHDCGTGPQTMQPLLQCPLVEGTRTMKGCT